MDILLPNRFITPEFQAAARETGWEGDFLPLAPRQPRKVDKLLGRIHGRGTNDRKFECPSPESAGRAVILVHAWPMARLELQDLVARLPGLRWVHTAYSGFEIAAPAVAGRDLLLTNAGTGSGELPVEHASAMLLAMARRLPEHFTATTRREWVVPAARRLNGATVLVVGLGRIGGGIARIAAALGCHVIGVRRHPELGAPDGVAELICPSELQARLPETDFVLLAVPATTETRNLVDGGFLSAMKPGAVLLNVGRGETVDETALVESLRKGHLGGACLDVVRHEPLPSDSPLYRAPNLWLTHHTAYRSGLGEHEARSKKVFLVNLERFVRGLPLQNQVDPGQGY
jgi:phosphoglycerate dehydrogenase-like enzyme